MSGRRSCCLLRRLKAILPAIAAGGHTGLCAGLVAGHGLRRVGARMLVIAAENLLALLEPGCAQPPHVARTEILAFDEVGPTRLVIQTPDIVPGAAAPEGLVGRQIQRGGIVDRDPG